jgi:pseudouridine-5'-phosphate glycosidase
VPSFDISADLEELARTAVAVVCAGPKAILNVPATIEYLETRGVPVVAIGSPDVPGFYARSSGIPAPISVADVDEGADLVASHLALGLGSGVLLCTPVPAEAALPADVARAAVEEAARDAEAAGIRGPATTPWLLSRVAEITAGASLRANRALIVHDALVAAQLAVRLAARLRTQPS